MSRERNSIVSFDPQEARTAPPDEEQVHHSYWASRYDYLNVEQNFKDHEEVMIRLLTISNQF